MALPTVRNKPCSKVLLHRGIEMPGRHMVRTKYLLLGISSGYCILVAGVAWQSLLRTCFLSLKQIGRLLGDFLFLGFVDAFKIFLSDKGKCEAVDILLSEKFDVRSGLQPYFAVICGKCDHYSIDMPFTVAEVFRLELKRFNTIWAYKELLPCVDQFRADLLLSETYVQSLDRQVASCISGLGSVPSKVTSSRNLIKHFRS